MALLKFSSRIKGKWIHFSEHKAYGRWSQALGCQRLWCQVKGTKGSKPRELGLAALVLWQLLCTSDYFLLRL